MEMEFGGNGIRYPFDGDYPRKETIWYYPKILYLVPLEKGESPLSCDIFNEFKDSNLQV
jgi:hypothetical protein